MTFGLRATAVGSVALAIAAFSQAQSSSDYRGIITPGGDFKLLYNAQQMFLLKFGLFYDGWNEYRGTAIGQQSDGGYLSQAPVSLGQMQVKTFLSVSGNTARLTIKATPSLALTANSAHLNVRFDPAFWADANFNSGSWSGTFPRRLDQTIYKTGSTSGFIVRNPSGFQVSIQSPSSGNFALRDSRPYNIGFELRAQETSGLWLAGVTKTYIIDVTPNAGMQIGPDQPVTVSQTADWVPLDHKLNVTPGSALDWTNPNPVYAGSKGWLKVAANGKFYFENAPNTPVKFYGTNITGSACFQSYAESDALAADLNRRGYNAVRMHAFDDLIIAPEAANSTTMSVYWSDRFMYFIEALKRQGIYVALDLYTMRKTRIDEVMVGGALAYPEYKAGLLCSPSVRANFLTFAKNLLNLYNPHAGKKLKDDPGIAWLSLVNENNPMWTPTSILRPELATMLVSAAGGTWDISTDAGARKADEMLTSEWDYLSGVLRTDGANALMGMINSGEQTAISRTRSRLDFVENHVYYAIPQWLNGRHNVPFIQTAVPPIASIRDFGRYAASRQLNKPFVVGEMNACAPNPYRGEFGLFMGAVASIQQWDGLWRFNFAERPQQLTTIYSIEENSSLTDPAALATERALIALYMRGDLTHNEAPTVIHVPWSEVGLSENKEVPIVKNAVLKTPIAMSHSQGTENPQTSILNGVSYSTGGKVMADLFKQWLVINTPKTCGVIGNPWLNYYAGPLFVHPQKTRASVWVSSLDHQDIRNSARMLLVHLTEVQNTGVSWSGTERSTVTAFGTLPHLVRDASALIRLKVNNPSTATVYRLDMSGQRKGTLAVSRGTDEISFTTSVRNPTDGKATIFYEVVQ